MTQLTSTPTRTRLRIASWNLRYDVQPDTIPISASLAALPDPRAAPTARKARGEQPWSTRRIRVAQRLRAARVDVIGFQETLVRQVEDLAELLGPDFAWIGVGRDDGAAAGEFSPLFYRRAALELAQSDTFWLAPAPFTPGALFPGAGCPRLATCARFRVRSGGAETEALVVLNTHLDNVSDAQRRLGAGMLRHRAAHEALANTPVLLTGDFNSEAEGADSGAYAVLTGAQPAPALPPAFLARFPLPAGGDAGDYTMLDLRAEAPRGAVGGHWHTFVGFEARAKDACCIDFVFGGSNRGWEAEGVFVQGVEDDDGVLASDHRLVLADVVL
ncbi:Endonuclease/exonuclease/phosphatase [Gloeopeniophorella convolvens]|nr:Endonuclease/exonuclease/phosphatase [Gloeopeniophorella convolvens]